MKTITRKYTLKGIDKDNFGLNTIYLEININKKSKNYGKCSAIEFDSLKSLRENPLNTMDREKKLHIAMLILEDTNYSKIFTSKN